MRRQAGVMLATSPPPPGVVLICATRAILIKFQYLYLSYWFSLLPPCEKVDITWCTGADWQPLLYSVKPHWSWWDIQHNTIAKIILYEAVQVLLSSQASCFCCSEHLQIHAADAHITLPSVSFHLKLHSQRTQDTSLDPEQDFWEGWEEKEKRISLFLSSSSLRRCSNGGTVCISMHFLRLLAE